MLLFRFGPEGFFAAGESVTAARLLFSDPFAVPPSQWSFGRAVDLAKEALRAPVEPGKVIGVGRNYREHALELGNPVPVEPMIFLKSPGAVIGPSAPIVLPPESERVEYEGEVAVVVRHRLRRAGAADAARGILGVCAANDVTARDLQKRDNRFSRAKSFDTFCPLGPAIAVEPDLDTLAVATRVNGAERQRATVGEMLFGIVELVVWCSRMMTLEPGDVILSGTPSGVGPLRDGDQVTVAIEGLGELTNPVRARRE